ncbi:MotA/TolQ/ExbB proton channel family protein [Glaciimonas sp. CA11.2]|uniref:MotA/TolQ/ExbB proton channel family protein n=1 Tax=unclassified Glaciimonas TaxID=2644401 RepID=UPI002AB36078|nr:MULTISPECIES: MotA/TolQ/ExbB proton channel family protein [unclassified Glaciimonas]MDY7549219.1 MotA/TolQ/ExbB proton channel family protein [Glaciimonas sp. CA11.2]MEB0013953.1 MotA/TolQ/ExbB proton channel family protein [Glaciimonas sp. Cout2]MEB0083157.1 MotA/TolQ/ExbB proton channel family protein [Glaciimonas sp. Gout2]MEB0161648.1 MotA/TolQ/ExbB proton channel family protein [Glaciimonas sp. CA11.2]
MNMQLFHQLAFYVMYACAALAIFVIIERGLFFNYTLRQAIGLEKAMTHAVQHVQELPQELTAQPSLPLTLVSDILAEKHQLTTEKDLEDFSESVYIANRGAVQHRLWILDTIVTAAPLLGLLGTILGIIDTFKALAVSGVSDPGQVSQGIGTALYATALGIGIAVVGMFFFNMFQERIERINDHLKVLMLRACVGGITDKRTQIQAAAEPNKLHIA